VGDDITIMQKKYYGHWLVHLLLVTTCLTGNIIYALVSYFILTDKIALKVKKK